MTSVDSNFNFLCGRPHGAGPPPPVHMRPPEPDSLPPPCGRHKWMAPYMRDTLHSLPIRQHIFCRVAVLAWHRLLGIAPVYLQELCRPVSTLVGRQALRSSSGGKLLVPRVNTSTMQNSSADWVWLRAKGARRRPCLNERPEQSRAYSTNS